MRWRCAGGARECQCWCPEGPTSPPAIERASSPGARLRGLSRCATRGQLLRGDERGNGRLRLGHARSASVHGSCATVWTVRSNPIPSEHRPVHARRAIQPRLAVDRTCSRLAPSPPESRHRSGRTAWLLAVGCRRRPGDVTMARRVPLHRAASANPGSSKRAGQSRNRTNASISASSIGGGSRTRMVK